MDKKLEWFPLYVEKWLLNRRVLTLTNEQRGIYLWLLCHQWRDDFLPYDITDVYTLLPPNTNSAAATYVLTQFFPADPVDNRRRNPTLAAIRDRQIAAYKSRVSTAAEARKSKKDNAIVSDYPSRKVSDEAEVLYIYNLSFSEKQQLPKEVIAGGMPFLLPVKTRAARFGVLRGLLHGMTGTPIGAPALARGLWDMTASGIEFTPARVRAWAIRAGKLLEGEAGQRAAEASKPVLRQPDANQRHSGTGFSEEDLGE